MRIASDLHDEVATNLSSIAMFSTLVKGEIARPSPFLDRITALSHESLESIREIIWSIDPEARDDRGAPRTPARRDGDVVPCARHAVDRARARRRRRSRTLAPDQRKNLWLMLKEAVSNAVKHSGGTAVSVIVTPAGRQVRITVRDNGPGSGADGALPQGAAAGRGLATMTARAEALGGTAAITFEPGRGTTVEFVVPLGR